MQQEAQLPQAQGSQVDAGIEALRTPRVYADGGMMRRCWRWVRGVYVREVHDEQVSVVEARPAREVRNEQVSGIDARPAREVRDERVSGIDTQPARGIHDEREKALDKGIGNNYE